MKYAKYLTFIPLVVWIILYTVLVAVIVYFTQLKFLYVLLFIAVFCLFDLIWWALVMNYKKTLDRFTIFSFLIVLNFPAYWLAKKAREYAINEEIKKTGHAKNLIHPELDSEYDFLPDWEKAIIQKKQAKKVKPQPTQSLNDVMFELQRTVINSYNKFLLYQVLSTHPELTQTFEINQLIKKYVHTPTTRQKMILEFTKNYQNWLVIDLTQYPNLKDPNHYIINVLKEVSPEEILVSYKQNRVDNTIAIRKILAQEAEKKQ